ncbi:M28 family metallopeptidase [Melioribacter sp. OK-6-Me]|uniref:M28 family metallopeptidase n=1 Tax=unclassified Melioribacter TaxID=2627329 RepID=UPI003ED9EB15
MKKIITAALFIATFISIKSQTVNEALNQIDEFSLIDRVKILSSDKFLGRAPGHEGEEKTIEYLKKEYKKLGLKAPSDNYEQKFELVELTPEVSPVIEFVKGDKKVSLKYADEFVAITRHIQKSIEIPLTEVVFAGYGINAPEYGWNDFEGIDVKDKIIIVLVNDPGFKTGDTSLFTGKAMTYYGRWTYKYEEAARQGAAGIFIIHETEAASYPWEVVRNGRVGPQFFIEDDSKNSSRSKFEGWITFDKAKEIFELAGLDLQKEIENAAKPGFRSRSLGLKTSLKIKNKINRIETRNLIGILPGSEKADEYLIYMAHWDHLGYDPNLKGDNIYNGARDNALGVASILEIAEAFSKVNHKRSIAFLSLAGEEQGLLGSEYYVNNPVIPLSKTIAAFNFDGGNIFGKTKDIAVLGLGNSELDSYIKSVGKEFGKTIVPDPTPETGGFYRSDHYNFVKAGIPSLYLKQGVIAENGETNIPELSRQWTKEHYHKVSDEYSSKWDLSGAIEEIKILFEIGYRLSNDGNYPKILRK